MNEEQFDKEQFFKEFNEAEAGILLFLKEYEEELPYMSEITKKERQLTCEEIKDEIQKMLDILKEK